MNRFAKHGGVFFGLLHLVARDQRLAPMFLYDHQLTCAYICCYLWRMPPKTCSIDVWIPANQVFVASTGGFYRSGISPFQRENSHDTIWDVPFLETNISQSKGKFQSMIFLGDRRICHFPGVLFFPPCWPHPGLETKI